MAEVKLKYGYIKIANNLFEQLFIRDFTLKQLRILLLIFRLSYGFNKTEAVVIPISRFDIANIHKSDVKRVLQELQEHNIIICDFGNNVFTLNKNFDDWTVDFHSAFSEENFLNLKSKQYNEKLVNHQQISDEKVGETPTMELVNHQPKMKKSWQITNHEVGKSPTKNAKKLVNHQLRHPENRYYARVTGHRKYIIKDIYKYIYYKEKFKKNKNKNLSKKPPENFSKNAKNFSKKFDPFFNPVVRSFKEEYRKVFKQVCYLNAGQTRSLVEIAADNPGFKEIIPELLERYKNTIFQFKTGKKRPSLRWLLEDGNWSGVMNGDFEEIQEVECGSDYYVN